MNGVIDMNVRNSTSVQQMSSPRLYHAEPPSPHHRFDTNSSSSTDYCFVLLPMFVSTLAGCAIPKQGGGRKLCCSVPLGTVLCLLFHAHSQCYWMFFSFPFACEPWVFSMSGVVGAASW